MLYPTQLQLKALYEANEEIIQHLTQQPIISAEDLQGKHKNVLTRLASDYWGCLSPEAREALLEHPHHFVRSSAVIGQQDLAKVLAGDIQALNAQQLRLRRQDLARRAAEMGTDEALQESILTQGSQANSDMVCINVELHAVRTRLTSLGYPETPDNLIWI